MKINIVTEKKVNEMINFMQQIILNFITQKKDEQKVDINRNIASDRNPKQRQVNTKDLLASSRYSKQDILEQYCISDKSIELEELENDKIFAGCLSSNSKNSFFTICLKKRFSSDENLSQACCLEKFEIERRNMLKSPVAQNENFVRQSCFINQSLPNREKHVSFAASQNLTSFEKNTQATSKLKSQKPYVKCEERLLDGKTTIDWSLKNAQSTFIQSSPFLDKLKKTCMKAQATQTESKCQHDECSKERKLLKSQSENYSENKKSSEHDALIRTYSEQPVKSYLSAQQAIVSSFDGECDANDDENEDNNNSSNSNNNNNNEIVRLNESSENCKKKVCLNREPIRFNVENGDIKNENKIYAASKEILIDFKPNLQGSSDQFLHMLKNCCDNGIIKNNLDCNEQQVSDFVFSSLSDSLDDDRKNSLVSNQTNNSYEDDCFHEKYLNSNHNSLSVHQSNDSLKLDQSDSIWNESEPTILQMANSLLLNQQKETFQGAKEVKNGQQEEKNMVMTTVADTSESTTETYVTANSDSFKTNVTIPNEPIAAIKRISEENNSSSSGTYSVEDNDIQINLKSFSNLCSKSSEVLHENGIFDCTHCSNCGHALLDSKSTNSLTNQQLLHMSYLKSKIKNFNENIYEWIFIDEKEEIKMWNIKESLDFKSCNRLTFTLSENEFQLKYKTLSHRIVHRKVCLEMYERQESNSFEANKSVTIQKSNGEFGLRIHGSKPVVISSIEPNTPAEKSSLDVGDIIVSINSINLMNKNHSDVVKIANNSPDVINLKVVSTLTNRSNATPSVDHDILFANYLWKLNHRQSSDENDKKSKWLRRWFCLKTNCYLYQFRNRADTIPLSVIIINGSEIVSESVTRVKPVENAHLGLYRLCIRPKASATLHLASNCQDIIEQFQTVLQSAVRIECFLTKWKNQVLSNRNLNPDEFTDVDYAGLLSRLNTQTNCWNAVYCVLKQACLYVYAHAKSDQASELIILFGYKVQLSNVHGKRHVFELCAANESDSERFHFHADIEFERKRWFAAFEYSIDKWLRV